MVQRPHGRWHDWAERTNDWAATDWSGHNWGSSDTSDPAAGGLWFVTARIAGAAAGGSARPSEPHWFDRAGNAQPVAAA